MAIRDYVSVANEYIEEVLSGKQPACQFVKMACERQKRDLADGVLGYRLTSVTPPGCAFLSKT